jgi:hypothetical protein
MTVQHHPKSTTQKFGLSVQFPDNYVATSKFPIMLFGHGIGECNDGSLAGIRRTYEHPLYASVKNLCAKRGIILVMVNTDSNHYRNGEHIYCMDWATNNLPEDPNNWIAAGHSLGGHGLMNTALLNDAFVKRVNILLISATGGYPYTTGVFKKLVDNNIRYWGITCLADHVPPKYTQWIYQQMKLLRPEAKAILTEMPYDTFNATSTQTKAQVSHNAVLGRLMSMPVGFTASMTSGIPANESIKMDVGTWIKVNPKGARYQPPTEATTSPTWEPAPQPVSKTLVRVVCTANWNNRGSVDTQFQYSDGSAVMHLPPAGDRNIGTAINILSKTVALDFQQNPNKSIPW